MKRILDLFCGQGGAARGYADAGWEVMGADIADQPRYPYHFVRADWREALRLFGPEVDAIHASPPCQAYSCLRHATASKGACAANLVDEVRDALNASGVPWVMENVPGAPLHWPLLLCGSMFGLGVRTHRLFESSQLLLAPGECRHVAQGPTVGVYGRGGSAVSELPRAKGRYARKEAAAEAMGIDWMSYAGLSQAIPPAYTRWIGRQLGGW